MNPEGWDDDDRRDAALLRVGIDIEASPLIPEEFLGLMTGARPEGDPTRGELDVLIAFSRGLSYPAVAEVLGRGLETVKSQAKQARFLLRAKNTTEACCEAIRRGLIP